MIDSLVIGGLYSNEEIFRSLKVSNAGGIRLSLQGAAVMRAVLMISEGGLHGVGENPYHDRLEGEILTYTASGKLGEQTIGGLNGRLIEQKDAGFPIYGFVLTASRRDKAVGSKRWRYLGLLQYLRHYEDLQLDSKGKVRRVWLFEFKVHDEPVTLVLASETAAASQVFQLSRCQGSMPTDDDEIIRGDERDETDVVRCLERVRSRLLAMEPKAFEHFVKDLLVHCGFHDVCVTKFSADGGVDVSARASSRIWILEHTLVQVQAKRWLHSVGRKEIAELRGSLQPFAKGAVITTSHFSRAALKEATEEGKNPITLVDGPKLAKVVLDEGFHLPT